MRACTLADANDVHVHCVYTCTMYMYIHVHIAYACTEVITMYIHDKGPFCNPDRFKTFQTGPMVFDPSRRFRNS